MRHFLRPGGRLYFLDSRPTALVFDDEARPVEAGPDDLPGWFVPYFETTARTLNEPSDYADPEAILHNTRVVVWMHTVSAVVTALLEVGLELRALREHDAIAWRMFRWPDRPWLPLAFTVLAEAR